MEYLDKLIQRAKKNKKIIVLPETSDIRVLKAASMILENEISDIILIGNKKDILKLGEGLDFSKAKIVDPCDHERSEEYINKLYELRKHKCVTIEKARELLLDPLYLGVMMVKMDDADGMVAGAINSTSNTLRPALQILKTAPGIDLVSSCMIMVVPDPGYGEDGVMIFADCAIIEDPSAKQLADIAIASADSFRKFANAEAKIAMLSYSTYKSACSPMTQKVVDATAIVKAKAPHLKVDGELQLDAAIVPSVAKLKAKGSTIAGYCNTLIFPDLNAGNISYKLVQRLAKAEAYGPITQGLAKPVNDLSRGCFAEDIVGVVAITAIQAMM